MADLDNAKMRYSCKTSIAVQSANAEWRNIAESLLVENHYMFMSVYVLRIRHASSFSFSSAAPVQLKT